MGECFGREEARPRGCGRAAPRGWLGRGVLLPALDAEAQELVGAGFAAVVFMGIARATALRLAFQTAVILSGAVEPLMTGL